MVFLRNIAIFTAVDIASLAIGLFTSPITTRLLTLKQYGTIPLLSAVWESLFRKPKWPANSVVKSR